MATNTTEIFAARLDIKMEQAKQLVAAGKNADQLLEQIDADAEHLDKLEKEAAAKASRSTTDANMRASIDALTGGLVYGTGNGGGRIVLAGRHQSIGELFASNADIQQFIKAGGHRRANFTSPTVEVPPEFRAATITEGTGGVVVPPQYLPGIVPLPTRPLVVADLIAPGVTGSSTVSYMHEKTVVNAADTVLEGGVKPESTIAFEPVSEPVRKIATWIPCSEEALDDLAQLQSHVTARLGQFVDLAEDDQLLNGTAVAPDIVGFLNRVGLATSLARTTETNADLVLQQIMAIWTTTSLMPTGIVMHPLNWETVLKSKTTAGDYYGNGPFMAPSAPTMWGVPVALTTAIVAGTALVGAFRTASQLFRKGGLSIDMSNSHQDFFVKNLVAIRAERREALAVYRPSAFGTCTNLN